MVDAGVLFCASGEVATIRGLQAMASAVTGEQFRLSRVGGLGAFGTLIKVTRALMPTSDDVFPP